MISITKENPFISIFVPAFNSEKYIQLTIESVLKQTYNNFELIIIDDASTDKTAQIIQAYTSIPRVKIYHNAINLGVTGNWHYGVSLCSGEYIIRLDADDYYSPYYLEKLVTFLENSQNLVMVFTGANIVQPNKIQPELFYSQSWIQSGQDFLPEILRFCPIRASSVCLHRSNYERLGGVLDDLKIHHDWEFWVRIAATNQFIGYIAEPLIYYRHLNEMGCTSQAIINAASPRDCEIWLQYLKTKFLPYQLNLEQLSLLKEGMYNIVMAFAVFAQEGGLENSVQKHMEFARSLLPENERDSLQSRLYVRAAEIYFMEGGYHLKGWKFLLQSLRYGFLASNAFKKPKLWARAFFGKKLFEFVRTHTVARHKFPRVEVDLN